MCCFRPVRGIDTDGSGCRRLGAGLLFLDTQSEKCSLAGKEISLLAKEYAILHFLLTNKGKLFSSEDLCLASICFAGLDSLNLPVEYRVISAQIESDSVHSVLGPAGIALN